MVLPNGYEGFTAAKKQEVLWQNCVDTAYKSPEEVLAHNSDAPAFEALKIMVPFYTHATLLDESDELLRKRKKVIHPHGW